MRPLDKDCCVLRLWTIAAIRAVAIFWVLQFVVVYSGAIFSHTLSPFVTFVEALDTYRRVWLDLVIRVVFCSVLWLIAPKLVRLIVPDYTSRCPKCRFSLENFRADRCPECGLYLGEDFHAPPPPSQSESPSE